MKDVEIVDTLAKSRKEKPPMVTQLSTPGVFFKMASILTATSRRRGCDEPGGVRHSKTQ